MHSKKRKRPHEKKLRKHQCIPMRRCVIELNKVEQKSATEKVWRSRHSFIVAQCTPLTEQRCLNEPLRERSNIIKRQQCGSVGVSLPLRCLYR
jgi:hypothetical protein